MQPVIRNGGILCAGKFGLIAVFPEYHAGLFIEHFPIELVV